MPMQFGPMMRNKIGPGRLAHLLGQAAGYAGRDDDRGAAALASELGESRCGTACGGVATTAELRHEGERFRGRVAGPAEHAGAAGIYEADLAIEAARKRFSATCNPIEPGLSLAPTSATLLGWNRKLRFRMVMATLRQVAPQSCRQRRQTEHFRGI